MSKHREGIYQRPGSPYWYYDVVDAAGRRHRRSTGTAVKTEAQAIRDRMKVQSWEVRAGRTPDYTFSQAVERWLDEKGHKKSIGDDAQMLAWWVEKVGHLTLSKLTRDLLTSWLNAKKAESSPSRANRYLAVVRAVLRKAEREWLWLQKAPVLSKFPEPKARFRYLEDHEITRLLAELPEHQAAIAEFAFATGMRQSNVLRLKWTDVDLARQVAWVHPDETKNGRPFATVLNADAMRVITAQTGKHPVFVFTYRGNPVGQVNTETWRDALKRAGIKDFRWHDTRHTWASRLVQKGVPINVVQVLGGWEKGDMVQRYAHLAPDHLLEYAEKGVRDKIVFPTDTN